jgi:hypothetical protein
MFFTIKNLNVIIAVMSLIESDDGVIYLPDFKENVRLLPLSMRVLAEDFDCMDALASEQESTLSEAGRELFHRGVEVQQALDSGRRVVIVDGTRVVGEIK